MLNSLKFCLTDLACKTRKMTKNNQELSKKYQKKQSWRPSLQLKSQCAEAQDYFMVSKKDYSVIPGWPRLQTCPPEEDKIPMRWSVGITSWSLEDHDCKPVRRRRIKSQCAEAGDYFRDPWLTATATKIPMCWSTL